MRKVLFCILLFVMSIFLFAQGEPLIIGSYKDAKGNILEIFSDHFILNGKSKIDILIGQKSIDQGLIMLGGIRYYIKPSYSQKTDVRATLTNILLQSSDNQMLGVNIFDYDIKSNTIKYITWNIFSISFDGVYIMEFKKM